MKSGVRFEERVAAKLRALYARYGYSTYKMRKFEEYDLYAENRDFLLGDRIVTFTDVDGKLMALKPDVTMSIIKDTPDRAHGVAKVCYSENVYRAPRGEEAFREIMQTGLECMGKLDAYDEAEAVLLAAKSLEAVSDEYVLDVSHMGLVSAMLTEAGLPDDARPEAVGLIAEKNMHSLRELCVGRGVDPERTDALILIAGTYGKPCDVLPKIEAFVCSDEGKCAAAELERVLRIIESTPEAEHINIDFSVVNDMNYYSGLVFRGYVSGVSRGVLGGGRYDLLMKKMGRSSGAIGFAVYEDMLVPENDGSDGFDADVLVLYDDGTDRAELMRKTEELRSDGKSVLAAPDCSDAKCASVVDMRKKRS